MESVVFDGKEFVKASVLAEKFGYTQDYLGQLCRGKKVDARLVGRAWHINLDSLLSHRTARYKSSPEQKEVEVKKAPNHYLSRIDVEPILKQKTVKILRNEAGKLSEFPVKYVGDDYSLIPHVNKSAISSYLHIAPADAEILTIHKEKGTVAITNFEAEPLPEFSLSGTLDIEGILEVTEDSLALPPKKVLEIPGKEEVPQPARAVRSLKLRTIARSLPVPSLPSMEMPKTAHKKLAPTAMSGRSTATHTGVARAPSFAPVSVTRVNTPVASGYSSFALPLLGVVLGILSSFLILMTEVTVEANRVSYTDDFIFKIENLQQTAEVILSKLH